MTALTYGEIFPGARVRATDTIQNNIGKKYPEGSELVVQDKRGPVDRRTGLQAVLLQPISASADDATWFYFNSAEVLGIPELTGKLEIAE